MYSNLVLRCPGRNTSTHLEFISEYPQVKDHHILCLDTAQADFVYASGSKKLTLCSKERYLLELHRFLLVKSAHILVKDVWENRYDTGLNWEQRSRDLASFNSKDRGRILRNWEDVAIYYCILTMSGFNYHYNKWKFVGEHTPIMPKYENLRFWAENFSNTEIKFQPRSVKTFKTTAVDENTIIYFNFPYQYGSYGCRYLWTKKKFDNMVKDLTELAIMGHKVCVSTPFINRGRHLRHFTRILPESVFRQVIFHEVKAFKGEAFYVSGF